MPRTLKVVTIPPPPATPRSDVVDIVHGERITDPYRWLGRSLGSREGLDRPPERANSRSARSSSGAPVPRRAPARAAVGRAPVHAAADRRADVPYQAGGRTEASCALRAGRRLRSRPARRRPERA